MDGRGRRETLTGGGWGAGAEIRKNGGWENKQ